MSPQALRMLVFVAFYGGFALIVWAAFIDWSVTLLSMVGSLCVHSAILLMTKTNMRRSHD